MTVAAHLRVSRAAGCGGDVVWLAGGNVTYLGRHVEHFPAAMP